jgi:glycosyltransferase involved in cell wall biosynthesis
MRHATDGIVDGEMNELPFNGRRLLLLAHSCNPEIGSEPGLGWNRALQAAKVLPTWVICDEAYNRAAIERYIGRNGPIPNLEFVYVPPSRTEEFLQRFPGMFYPSYNLWHRRAFQIARQLHNRLRFDLIHQLNLCGFREPGYLWKLDAPFLWGPIGGAQNYPSRFLTSAGVAGAVSELIRSALNTWQLRTDRRVGLAARKARVLLAANSTNARQIAKRRRTAAQVMVETGVHLVPDQQPHDFHHDGPLRILWSGVFEHRKALHLLLHALAALPEDVKYELHILGRGPLEKRWRQIAQTLGVDRHCRWLGWLDQPDALREYAWADAFVFTSLRDTTGNVVLESFAAGTPVLCLDHQGMADIVNEHCGVKLPVTNPREVVKGLRDTLLLWHNDRDELERLSRGALQRAEYYSWETQGRRMAAIYREILGLGDASAEKSHFESSASEVLAEPVAAGSQQGGSL